MIFGERFFLLFRFPTVPCVAVGHVVISVLRNFSNQGLGGWEKVSLPGGLTLPPSPSGREEEVPSCISGSTADSPIYPSAEKSYSNKCGSSLFSIFFNKELLKYFKNFIFYFYKICVNKDTA